MSNPILNKHLTVNGIEIFYREAGDKKNPSILLLHGFPSSSVMFSLEEAYCYQRDLPDAQLYILDGGHMALETNFEEVLELIKKFVHDEAI